MKISDVVENIKTSLSGVGANSENPVVVEFWTVDGKNISEIQRGVKITIPIRRLPGKGLPVLVEKS